LTAILFENDLEKFAQEDERARYILKRKYEQKVIVYSDDFGN